MWYWQAALWIGERFPWKAVGLWLLRIAKARIERRIANHD